MHRIRLHPKSTPQPAQIVVGKSLLSQLGQLIDVRSYSQVAVIAGSRTARHWLAPVQKALGSPLVIRLPATKPRKTLETAAQVYEKLHRAGFDRHALIVTLGGGVVGDFGGYVAATYLRGIDFTQVPTTLLAQADASVGGKVGVNLGDFKNGIGAFQLPRVVVSDTDTLGTLPTRELRNGLAEIIKLGLIADRSLFKRVESGLPNDLTSLITQAIRTKAAIVNRDERETGTRKLLNFGHTIGHAIESLSLRSGRPMKHGEAVSLGMLAESRLAVALGICPSTVPTNLETALRQARLPITAKRIPLDAALELINHDKKNRHRTISWTLPTGIGRGSYDVTAPERLARDAIRSLS